MSVILNIIQKILLLVVDLPLSGERERERERRE
jgi:hypothetical protein